MISSPLQSRWAALIRLDELLAESGCASAPTETWTFQEPIPSPFVDNGTQRSDNGLYGSVAQQRHLIVRFAERREE